MFKEDLFYAGSLFFLVPQAVGRPPCYWPSQDNWTSLSRLVCPSSYILFKRQHLISLSFSFLQVKGETSYNGYRLDEFAARKTSAYISQYDLHIPEMTVRETIDFSARCQGVGSKAGRIPHSFNITHIGVSGIRCNSSFLGYFAYSFNIA